MRLIGFLGKIKPKSSPPNLVLVGVKAKPKSEKKNKHRTEKQSLEIYERENLR